MATPAKRSGSSYSEFARLPDDGRRYEVIAGELCVTPQPGTYHQLVAGRLARLLGGFVDEHDLGWVLGPVDVLFTEGDYLAPDLVFVRGERRGIISDRDIEAAPDLALEILSGSTAQRDRGIKRERYLHFGVPLYWIVDLDAGRIDVYRLAEVADRPVSFTEALEWWPVPGHPALTFSIPDLLRGFD